MLLDTRQQLSDSSVIFQTISSQVNWCLKHQILFQNLTLNFSHLKHTQTHKQFYYIPYLIIVFKQIVIIFILFMNRSHIPIQKDKPKSRIIKRVTITPLDQTIQAAPNTETKPLTSPFQTHYLTQTTNHQLAVNHKQQDNDITQGISRNDISGSFAQNPLDRSTQNRPSVSRSPGRRTKIWDKQAQKIVQSKYERGVNGLGNSNFENGMSDNSPSRLKQTNSVYDLQYTSLASKSPNATAFQSPHSPKQYLSEKLSQHLITMPIEVFTYPSRLPESCCKVEHSRD